MIYCKNAEIKFSSYYAAFDYTAYWLSIDYKKPLFFLNSKQVTYIEIESPNLCTEKITDFIKAHLEEKHALSYAELAAIAARFHVRKDNFTQVRFSDGTIYKNEEINWNATE